ncbi:MAG: tyrosine-type recombinase/integrase [Oligoflexales bacterium]
MDSSESTLEEFSSYLKSKGKQLATIESYSRDAKSFLKFLGTHRITFINLEPASLISYQQHLWHQNVKINSIRRAMIGIKQFIRFLLEEKDLGTNPFEDIPLPARDEELRGEVEHIDILNLIAIANSQTSQLKSKRDAALLSLLSFEGLKLSEIINLTWNDFLANQGLASLRIVGNRSRILGTCSESTKWLCSYQSQLKACFPANSFPHLYKRMFIAFKGRDSENPEEKISRHGLKFMLYELGDLAQIKKLNSELLRHYAIHYQILLGRTPEEIMKHFGLRRLGNIAKHFTKHLPSSTPHLEKKPNIIRERTID